VEPQRVCGVTVAETFQTDAQNGRGHMTHDADDGDDFGDFTNGVMIEEFAVFESSVVDGPTGSWATVTRPVPATIDDYEFDDFETAEFQCAPVNCVGFDDGKVSISCVSPKSATSTVRTVRGVFSLLWILCLAKLNDTYCNPDPFEIEFVVIFVRVLMLPCKHPV
jgi:hypothetical protein